MDTIGRLIHQKSTLPIQHTELKVLGAANEVLVAYVQGSADARAVIYQHEELTIRVVAPVVREHLRGQEQDWREKINALLERRYGGPRVTRVTYRVVTEP